MTETFHQRVMTLVKRIPKGRVATYGQIAALAGNPRGARQVVRTLNVAAEKERLPWHRIIDRDGKISLKPSQGYELQRSLLVGEGVMFDQTYDIPLTNYQWRPRVK
jgi:methylated-DNA-protein-cysteine methyltransferase-like protein